MSIFHYYLISPMIIDAGGELVFFNEPEGKFSPIKLNQRQVCYRTDECDAGYVCKFSCSQSQLYQPNANCLEGVCVKQ